jgi:hypothetical protein
LILLWIHHLQTYHHIGSLFIVHRTLHFITKTRDVQRTPGTKIRVVLLLETSAMTHHVSKGTFCWPACSVYWDTSHECSNTRPHAFWLSSDCRHGSISENCVRFPSITKDILRQASGHSRRQIAPPIKYWTPGVPYCESNGQGVKLVTGFHLVHRPRMHGVIPPSFIYAYRWWRKHSDKVTFQLASVTAKKVPSFTVPVLFSTAVQHSETHPVEVQSAPKDGVFSPNTVYVWLRSELLQIITVAVTCVIGSLLYLATKCII